MSAARPGVVMAMTANKKLVYALAAGAAVQLATAFELAAVVRRANARVSPLPAPATR